ncbi:MAG: peptidyl-tRNA hydrolase Pth2 [Nanopusillaceae archaeon]
MYKLVVVVRKDLDIGKGKLCVQVAHAAVECVLQQLKNNKDLVDAWRREGAKKIVLYVENLEKLLDIYQKAIKDGLNSVLISDAGLTQLEPGTITCVGIGPDEEDKIDKITGTLKLL